MVRNGKILVVLGCILIMISGIMMSYNNYNNKRAFTESHKIYQKIQTKVLEEVTVDENNEFTEEMKTVNIDGNNYIATISIPVLDIELPVMADCDYKKMKIAPCRYYGSIMTNDLVICAHGYDNLFGRIKNLTSGDLLVLTDMNNNEYIYKVEVIEVLSPNDVKEMVESEFDLTLYTCTIDNLNRVTVRLNRV